MDLSRIALCLPGDIKTLIDKELDAESEQTLIALINAFSEACQRRDAMNRLLEKKTYTEYFDGDCRLIVVQAPPIVDDNTLAVYEDVERQFTTALVKYDDYSLLDNGENGAIKRLIGRFPYGAHIIKAVYNGGLVLNADGQITVPYDLRNACAMQVSYWFKNRNDLGLQSISMQSGTINLPNPSDFLLPVKKAILSYRHFRSF